MYYRISDYLDTYTIVSVVLLNIGNYLNDFLEQVLKSQQFSLNLYQVLSCFFWTYTKISAVPFLNMCQVLTVCLHMC